MQLSKTFLGLDYLPLEAEAGLQVAGADGIVGALEVDEELLRPLQSRVATHVRQGLLHPHFLLLCTSLDSLVNLGGYIFYVVRVDNKDAAQEPCTS